MSANFFKTHSVHKEANGLLTARAISGWQTAGKPVTFASSSSPGSLEPHSQTLCSGESSPAGRRPVMPQLATARRVLFSQ